MPTENQLARLIVTVPPTAPVVTADECVSFLKLQDVVPGQLELFIDAATDYAETQMTCSLVERTFIATFYNGEPLILSRGPVLEVVSIAGAGDSSTAEFTLQACGHGLRVTLLQTVAYPISITYRAGYGPAASVPAAIKLAIMQHAGTLHRHRESVTDVSLSPVPHSLADFYRLKGRNVGIG